MLIDRDMTTLQLVEKAGFSANIITRLKRDEYISLESTEKICRVLHCNVDNILEFVEDK
jgi:DNA-binding Xre family transcriptional regulator